MIGFCHLRGSLRSFRLDRISGIKTVEAAFSCPDGFDALAHIMQAIATLPRKYPFELLLNTNIETAQREVFDVLGVLEADKDGILLRGSVDDLDWLARQLSVFSFGFMVRQPRELKEALKRHSAKLGSF